MQNEMIQSSIPKSVTNKELAAIKKRKQIIYSTLFYIAAVIVAIMMVTPFLWSLISSFASVDDINSLTMVWFPSKITTEHYIRVYTKVDVFRGLWNSLFTTIAGLVTNLFFGTLAAYAFSKIRFSGHKPIFNIMMVSMMIPGVITLVPTFYLLLRFPLMGGNNILGKGGIGFTIRTRR